MRPLFAESEEALRVSASEQHLAISKLYNLLIGLQIDLLGEVVCKGQNDNVQDYVKK